MKERLTVGEVLRPQGIAGALKVRPYVDDAKRFLDLKKVYIDGAPFKVIKATLAADSVFLYLGGVADRTAAELYRGKFLEIDREDAVPLEEGRYFVADVLGCAAVTETGKPLGTVEDIVSKPYADIYTLKTAEGKLVAFPLLKDVLKEIDVKNRVITLFEKRFSEVALYED
ncbi:MAG: 16S rRNA processing protein RimM [Bacillota bacterium]|nr:MAG: 16S rRNA processing protein RimM [Bacillota bacterium]